jgi:hypothetical protein
MAAREIVEELSGRMDWTVGEERE